MIDLTDRVAIVTGGASGIGRGICLTLARQGAHVAVADLNGEGARATAAEVSETGRESLALTADVTDRGSIEKMTADVVSRFGQIDILVNDAGVGGAKGWHEHPAPREEDWDLTFNVNVKGLVLTSQAVAEHMKARRYGKIVNIASIAGRVGRPPYPHYSVSKASVINWTQAHAQELAPQNINVNAVCPGLLWAPLWSELAQRMQALNPELRGLSHREVFERMVDQMVPMKKEQTPDDIGKLTAFLASDDAHQITGQAINIDGGARMN